jgi:hypothetical protein
MPALFTSAVSGPNAVSVSLNSRNVSAARATLARTASASPPDCSMSATIFWAAASLFK